MFAPALLIVLSTVPITATKADQAAARIAEDRRAGRPLVAHVIVALADNATQGIVPVPSHLGDGRDPKKNLYWGARYGLRQFLPKDARWSIAAFAAEHPEHVLERIVLTKELAGGERVFIVADAWDGTKIAGAIEAFTRIAAGHDAELVRAIAGDRTFELPAGGSAHVVTYLGHNGLMEITVPDPPLPPKDAPARSAIVLACISRSYFNPILERAGAHPLLMTRGLMAPEAYTLDAALDAWFRGRSPGEVKREAAASYCRYQRCSTRAGNALFASE